MAKNRPFGDCTATVKSTGSHCTAAAKGPDGLCDIHNRQSPSREQQQGTQIPVEAVAAVLELGPLGQGATQWQDSSQPQPAHAQQLLHQQRHSTPAQQSTSGGSQADAPPRCKGFVKATGERCSHPGKPEHQGFCGHHKGQADELAVLQPQLPGHEGSAGEVGSVRLQLLTHAELAELCRFQGLQDTGSKADCASRLQQAHLVLNELSQEQLAAVCDAECISSKGTAAQLVQRLSSNKAGQAPHAYESKRKQREAKTQQLHAQLQGLQQQPDKGAMSRAQFRKLLQGLGLVEEDQDVYHIIASDHGGADHVSNYHFLQNRAWNRAIGANYDYINCYLAGIQKAEKAVEVSRRMGNTKGQLYDGPSAAELYHRGEELMRHIRQLGRDARREENMARAAFERMGF